MLSSPARFWLAAIAAATGMAIGAALLLPYDWLELGTRAERQRGWLLTVFTAGVLGVLFGASSLLGRVAGVGFRDAVQAGDAAEAVRRDRDAHKASAREPYHRNFGWWIVATGSLLLLIYFSGWVLVGRPAGFS